MKLRPQAPSRIPQRAPEVVKPLLRASDCFIAAGTLSLSFGTYLLWGLPGTLVLVGLTSTALGAILRPR